MMVLSHVVTVAIVSTPARSCSASAMFSESMWVRAFSRGSTKTSPMPRSASSAATRSASPAHPVAGGVIEADTTNRPEDRLVGERAGCRVAAGRLGDAPRGAPGCARLLGPGRRGPRRPCLQRLGLRAQRVDGGA